MNVLTGKVPSRMKPALGAGVDISVIVALPVWRGKLQTSVAEARWLSHQPSLANREGMGIGEASPVTRRTMRKRSCNSREGDLQEFRISMQFLCNRAYALA